MNRVIFAALNESDKRALIIVIIIAIVLFLVLGFIGMGIRQLMKVQGKRMDTMMYDVTVAGVVNNPKAFKKLAGKKNRRLFYKQTLPAFLVALLGLLTWIISSAITGEWTLNMFTTFFSNEIWVQLVWPTTTVFGVTIIADWPTSVEGTPNFQVSHLGVYLSALLFLIAILMFAIVSLAFLSRSLRRISLQKKVFEKSLEGYNANDALNNGTSPDNNAPLQND